MLSAGPRVESEVPNASRHTREDRVTPKVSRLATTSSRILSTHTEQVLTTVTVEVEKSLASDNPSIELSCLVEGDYSVFMSISLSIAWLQP